jgi:hypothetical protein
MLKKEKEKNTIKICTFEMKNTDNKGLWYFFLREMEF